MRDRTDKGTTDIFKPNDIHGGKRRGAGKKKLPASDKPKTKVVRVPAEHLEAVKNIDNLITTLQQQKRLIDRYGDIETNPIKIDQLLYHAIHTPLSRLKAENKVGTSGQNMARLIETASQEIYTEICRLKIFPKSQE